MGDSDDVDSNRGSEVTEEVRKPNKTKEKRQNKMGQAKETGNEVVKSEPKSKKKDKKRVEEEIEQKLGKEKDSKRKEKNKQKSNDLDFSDDEQPKRSEDDEKLLSDEVDDEFYSKKRKAGRAKKKINEQHEVHTNQTGPKKKRGKALKKDVDGFDSDKEGSDVLSKVGELILDDGVDDDVTPSEAAGRFAKFHGLPLDTGEVTPDDPTENKDTEVIPPETAVLEDHMECTDPEVLGAIEQQMDAAPTAALTTADTDLNADLAGGVFEARDLPEPDLSAVKISRKELKKLKKQQEFDKLIEAAKKKVAENSGTLDNFALSQVRFACVKYHTESFCNYSLLIFRNTTSHFRGEYFI